MKNLLAYYVPANPERLRETAVRKLQQQARLRAEAKRAREQERDRRQGKPAG